MKMTKQQAAAMQIETAIKLFFEDRDMVSTYTLSAAAHEILEGIWMHEGPAINQRRLAAGKDFAYSFKEEWRDRVTPEGQKYRTKHQNFFKHADRDHDQELDFEDVEHTALSIFLAIKDYELIYETVTKAMSTYVTCYLMYNPSLLREGSVESEVFKKGAQMAKDVNIDRKGWCQVGNTMLKQNCPELFESPGFVGSHR